MCGYRGMKQINIFCFDISRVLSPLQIHLEIRNAHSIIHGVLIHRWLLNSPCVHMKEIKLYELFKAFGYIERVVNSEIFCRKIPILHHTCATCYELPSYISTMV